MGRRIPFNTVKPHQAAYLDDWCRAGAGVGLILLSFRLKRFFAVPWAFWRAGVDGWQSKTKTVVKFADAPYICAAGPAAFFFN